MRLSQAKKLKPGDRIIWQRPGGKIEGAVTKKRYNTVRIKWDNGIELDHRAEQMEGMFTQEQLDDIAREAEVGRKVQEFNQRKLKDPLP